jgi:hypothetical protein
MEECRYSSKYSLPLHYKDVNDKFYTLDTVPSNQEPGSRWIEDWLGPTAGRFAVKKRIIFKCFGNETEIP